MAGRRGSLPMRERIALSGRTGDRDPCPARHCWLTEPADRAAEKRAALLVEWRQTVGGRWQGRVVYLAHLRPGIWSMVEEWVDADKLTPE
jgi:hypothetical protein